ncbi:hypothetical protein ACTVJH_15695 [Desulfoplanes sp. PS50]|jgi:hypothetical protein
MPCAISLDSFKKSLKGEERLSFALLPGRYASLPGPLSCRESFESGKLMDGRYGHDRYFRLGALNEGCLPVRQRMFVFTSQFFILRQGNRKMRGQEHSPGSHFSSMPQVNQLVAGAANVHLLGFTLSQTGKRG